MHVLKIEYPVADYDSWKEHFDRDRLDREGSGVRRHRIFRPTDHPDYVMIDVDFDTAGEAEAYLAALHRHVYSERHPASVWNNPHTRIVEVVEDKESVLLILQRGSPIHRSAWKVVSANFVFTAFSQRVSVKVTHVALCTCAVSMRRLSD